MAGNIEIELELEPDDERSAGAGRRVAAPDASTRAARTRWWERRATRALVAVGVVGAIGVGAAATGGDGRLPSVAGTTSTVAAAGTASNTLVSTVPSAFAAPAAPADPGIGEGPFRVADTGQLETVDVGRPLLGAPTGLRLVARLTDGRIARIDVDGGTVAVVPRAEAPVVGAALLAAGPDWTITRPAGGGEGYLLHDDGRVMTLGALLTGPTAGVYPSDRPDQVWVVVDGLKPTTGYVQLVDLAGATQGTSLPLNGVGPLGPDGAGGVLVASTGGVYRAGRDGFQLLTTGVVLATSPSHLVVLECDTALDCRRVLVDRTTGQRVPLGPAPPGPTVPTLGAIAPGGARVAVRTPNAAGIEVLDVVTGTLTEIDASPRALTPSEAGPIVWSGDGRFLVFLDRHDDHLVAFDTTTSISSDLTPGLPPVADFVERTR